MSLECPDCRSIHVYYRHRRRWEKRLSALLGLTYFRCKDCRRSFSLTNAQLTGKSLIGWQWSATRAGMLQKLGPFGLPLLVVGVLVALSGIWFGWRYWQWREATTKPPSVIAVIGGGVVREIAAAQLAGEYPKIPVIVLGGSSRACLSEIFTEQRGIPANRVRGDYRSTSTLTNFTTLVPYLESGQLHKVLVVTDGGGWQRARTLGAIVLGSRGIAMQSALVEGPGSTRGESVGKTTLEAILAIGWTLLGDLGLPPGLLNSPTEAARQADTIAPACTKGYNAYYPVEIGQ